MMAALSTAPARHARIHLRGGLTLIAAVSDAMAELGWRSASLRVLGGPVERALFFTPQLTPGGAFFVGYGAPREAPGWLVFGDGTFGRAADGSSDWLHFHAVLAAPDGRAVGGHVSPADCVLGPDGLVAHAMSAEDANFAVNKCQQTGFSVLMPC